MTVEDLCWFIECMDLGGKSFRLYYNKEDYIFITYIDGILEYLIYNQNKPMKVGIF